MTPINELSRKMDKDIIERLVGGEMKPFGTYNFRYLMEEKMNQGEIGGLTLEKINKARRIMEETVKQQEWEDIIEFVSIWDKRQELYDWMHNKLGLRIYK